MNKELKIASYYAKRNLGRFYDDCLGNRLPEALGNTTKKTIDLHQKEYEIFEDDFDITFCDQGTLMENPILPNRRPKGFVYSFISDPSERPYLFINKIRPNLMCCLQIVPEKLVSYGKEFSCEVLLCPWFIRGLHYETSKDITAMCSGNTNPGPYKLRAEIYKYLQDLKRPDVVLSGGWDYGKYPLNLEEYYSHLSRTKYYFSGGIRDAEIPEKYFEACSYGATLVCPEMDIMKECGFISGVNYIALKDVNQIPEILDSPLWKTIGIAGQQFVASNHTVLQRVDLIRNCYEKYKRMV